MKLTVNGLLVPCPDNRIDAIIEADPAGEQAAPWTVIVKGGTVTVNYEGTGNALTITQLDGGRLVFGGDNGLLMPPPLFVDSLHVQPDFVTGKGASHA